MYKIMVNVAGVVVPRDYDGVRGLETDVGGEEGG